MTTDAQHRSLPPLMASPSSRTTSSSSGPPRTHHRNGVLDDATDVSVQSSSLSSTRPTTQNASKAPAKRPWAEGEGGTSASASKRWYGQPDWVGKERYDLECKEQDLVVEHEQIVEEQKLLGSGGQPAGAESLESERLRLESEIQRVRDDLRSLDNLSDCDSSASDDDTVRPLFSPRSPSRGRAENGR